MATTGFCLENCEKDNFSAKAVKSVHSSITTLMSAKTDDDNHGFYLVAEKTLFAETADGHGLGGFVQLGWADDDWNQIANYWGLGLNYTGLIPGRDRDSAGIFVGSARNGGKFMEFMKNIEGSPVEHTETAIELTYKAELFSGLSIQPDFQYIINPGMDPSLKNAFQVGTRVKIAF